MAAFSWIFYTKTISLFTELAFQLRAKGIQCKLASVCVQFSSLSKITHPESGKHVNKTTHDQLTKMHFANPFYGSNK